MRKYVAVYGDRQKSSFIERLSFDLPVQVSDAYLIICAEGEIRRAHKLTSKQIANAAYAVEVDLEL